MKFNNETSLTEFTYLTNLKLNENEIDIIAIIVSIIILFFN